MSRFIYFFVLITALLFGSMHGMENINNAPRTAKIILQGNDGVDIKILEYDQRILFISQTIQDLIQHTKADAEGNIVLNFREIDSQTLNRLLTILKSKCIQVHNDPEQLKILLKQRPTKRDIQEYKQYITPDYVQKLVNAANFLDLPDLKNFILAISSSPSQAEGKRKRDYLDEKSIDLDEYLQKKLQKTSLSEESELNTEFDPERFQHSLETAPELIHDIIHHLKDPESNKESFRYIMLMGESQTGKSTMARAIAWSLGRNYLFKTAPSLLAHYRNQTAENLRKLFNEELPHYESDPTKPWPVLIVDEFNALTDLHTSEHSDIADTAKELWTLLDKQQKNDKFFMIATTNVTKKMPQQLQKRFYNKIIEVGLLDPQACANMLRECLGRHKNIRLSARCNAKFLNQIAQRLDVAIKQVNGLKGIDRKLVEAFVDRAVLMAGKTPDKKLKRAHLELSLTETIKNITDFCDFSVQMTDEERRHRETMDQGRRQFEQSSSLQKNLASASVAIQTELATTTLWYGKENGYGDYQTNMTWNKVRNLWSTFFPNDPKPSKLPESKTEDPNPKPDCFLQ